MAHKADIHPSKKHSYVEMLSNPPFITHCKFEYILLLGILYLLGGFIMVMLQIKFDVQHDLGILKQTQEQTFLSMFTSTIHISYYYRPIISFLMKLMFVLFGFSAPLFRILHTILLLIVIVSFMYICRKFEVTFIPLLIGILYIISSPFIYNNIIFEFTMELGTFLVAAIYMLTLVFILHEPAHKIANFLMFGSLSLIAMFTREQGLIIPFVFMFYFALKKKYTQVTFTLLLLIGYIVFRLTFLGLNIYNSPFIAPTGFFTQFYSVWDLEQAFGKYPGVLYGYNILSNFLSLFTHQPVKGVFGISYQPIKETFGLLDRNIIRYFPIFSLSSIFIFIYLFQEKEKPQIVWSLLVATYLNILLGYNYSYERILFIAGFSYAVLLSLALQFFLEKYQFMKTRNIMINMLGGFFLVLWLWLGAKDQILTSLISPERGFLQALVLLATLRTLWYMHTRKKSMPSNGALKITIVFILLFMWMGISVDAQEKRRQMSQEILDVYYSNTKAPV